MYWSKLPDLSNPDVISFRARVGAEKLMQVMDCAQEAARHKTREIDAEHIKRWAGVRIDYAAKLLPLVYEWLSLVEACNKAELTPPPSTPSRGVASTPPSTPSRGVASTPPSTPSRGVDNEAKTRSYQDRASAPIDKIRGEVDIPPSSLSVGAPPAGGQTTAEAAKPIRQKKGERIPEGFAPPDSEVLKMRLECPGVDFALELEKFRDYWTAKAGQDGGKLDWVATWRNWIRTAHERASTRASPRKRLPSFQLNPPHTYDYSGPTVSKI